MVYKVTEETITGIANAIRTQTNSTEDIQVEDFAEEILSIKTVKDAEAAAKSALEAEGYMVSAQSSATAAAESAEEAAASAADSLRKADEAKEWAVGETESAKYYADEAAKEANNADSSYHDTYEIANYVLELKAEVENTISTAQGFTAEAWANGTKDGVAVGENDPQYNKHAWYWAQQAEAFANEIAKVAAAGNIFAEASLIDEGVTS